MSDEMNEKRVRGEGWKRAYETVRDEILTLALAPGALLSVLICRAPPSAKH